MNTRTLITIRDETGKERHTTLGRFFEDNLDAPDDLIWVITQLGRGLEAAVGGGAAPLFRIRLKGVPRL